MALEVIVVRYQRGRGWLARELSKNAAGKRPSFRIPYLSGKREAARIETLLNGLVADDVDFEWLRAASKHLMAQQVPIAQWPRAIEKLRAESIPLRIEAITLAEWREAFMAAKRSQPHPRRASKRLSRKTLDAYEQPLKRMIEYFGKKTLLTKAASDFLDFGRHRIDRVRSSSWRSNLSALRIAFRYAVAQGWLGRSPIDSLPSTMKPAPHVTPVDRTLSREQIGALLAAVDGAAPTGKKHEYHVARIRAHLASLYYVAWRPIDSILATPDCVDLDAGTISFTQIKTGRPHVVPILKPFKPILKAWLAVMPPDSPALFPNRLGQKYEQRGGIKKIFHAVSDAAGLPDWVTPYTLRHSMATELIYRGFTPAEVADMLGDATVDMVLKHYCHKRTSSLQKIAKTF